MNRLSLAGGFGPEEVGTISESSFVEDYVS